jgi:hypothetical protein
MPMPVNQAGHKDHSGSVYNLRTGGIYAVSDFDDPALIDENIQAFQLAKLRVHAEDIGAADQSSTRG